jgi:hypothetical protein
VCVRKGPFLCLHCTPVRLLHRSGVVPSAGTRSVPQQGAFAVAGLVTECAWNQGPGKLLLFGGGVLCWKRHVHGTPVYCLKAS